MNYIYDILVNFKKELYDFYEWDYTDNIEHIRKVPIFKVDEKSYEEIRNYNIKLDFPTKNKIVDKAEIFSNKNILKVPYLCLFTNGLEVIALKFNEECLSVGRSRLLIDEENEVLEIAEALTIEKIGYEKTKKIANLEFITKKELAKRKYIINELAKLKKEGNQNKLQYLYYECFNKEEKDKNKINAEFDEAIKNNWVQVAPILYNFFELTSSQK